MLFLAALHFFFLVNIDGTISVNTTDGAEVYQPRRRDVATAALTASSRARCVAAVRP